MTTYTEDLTQVPTHEIEQQLAEVLRNVPPDGALSDYKKPIVAALQAELDRRRANNGSAGTSS